LFDGLCIIHGSNVHYAIRDRPAIKCSPFEDSALLSPEEWSKNSRDCGECYLTDDGYQPQAPVSAPKHNPNAFLALDDEWNLPEPFTKGSDYRSGPHCVAGKDHNIRSHG
jgi:hypothetical protein